MADFNSILNTAADSVERPKPMPAGTYSAVVQGHKLDESSKKKTPYVRFEMRLLEAQEDVDQGELEAYGGLKDTSKLNLDFYLSESAMWRLKDFCGEKGLGLDVSGKTLKQLIAEAQDQVVGVVVAHRLSEDGEQAFAEIKSFVNLS